MYQNSWIQTNGLKNVKSLNALKCCHRANTICFILIIIFLMPYYYFTKLLGTTMVAMGNQNNPQAITVY